MGDEGFENSIAIVGMAGRFPGASNTQQYWENLCQGVDSVSRFTPEELREAGISESLISSPSYVKARGILEGVEFFDADFFGFTTREAQITDPQHRLFLECAWESLENAGYCPENYPGMIGVYGGTSMSTYFLNNIYPNQKLRETLGEYLIHIGNEKDFLTTRVAYKLNLKGPSLTIQTACSTSLVAICVACNHLLTYQCDMALAGGAAISLPQKSGYHYQEGMIFSPNGHCRPFDAQAQGTVPGNGVGIVVLKRLPDAMADGDHIYAVIKGYGINNDGLEKIGYAAPSVQGQADVVGSAIAMADINPETITYAEAHGTGTLLGDPIELAALTQAYRNYTQKSSYCAIGSSKSNVGHLIEAAGVAGLIKASLALDQLVIPPVIHFESPNPHIDFDNSPFYVNGHLTPWAESETPRRACVSSFGIGGTNAHVILEESPRRINNALESGPQLLVLSARTPHALQQMAANLGQYLKKHPDTSLADVAFTLQVGRKVFEHKLVLICRTIEEAIAFLLQPSKQVGCYSPESLEGKLYDLGQRWLTGETINWAELHQQEKRNRTPLPTYPFEKKRYWIDPLESNPAIQETPSLRTASEKKALSIEDIETTLLTIWKELFGTDCIGLDNDFYQLGGDSLLAIQIISQIKTQLGVPLKTQSLLESTTIAKLAREILRKLEASQGKTREVNTLPGIVKLRAGDNRTPLFLIHPIGGSVFCYRDLAESLQYRGPILGIQSAHLDTDAPPLFKSIPDLAAEYIQAVRTVQPQGPYRLIGASFGGLIAYEMARQLGDLGHTVVLLAMLDIVRPDDPSQHIHDDGDMLGLLIELFEGKPSDLRALSNQEKVTRLTTSMGLGKLPPSQQLRIFEQVKMYWQALMRYHPKPYFGKIAFFQAKERFSRNQDISLGKTWEELAKGGIDVHEVDGNHFTMIMEPNVRALSNQLDRYL